MGMGRKYDNPTHPYLVHIGVPAPVEDIRDPQQQASPLPSPDSSTPKIKAGDRVKVQLEADVFRMMQDGHGGWNDQMAEVRTTVCHVCNVHLECSCQIINNGNNILALIMIAM